MRGWLKRKETPEMALLNSFLEGQYLSEKLACVSECLPGCCALCIEVVSLGMARCGNLCYGLLMPLHLHIVQREVFTRNVYLMTS